MTYEHRTPQVNRVIAQPSTSPTLPAVKRHGVWNEGHSGVRDSLRAMLQQLPAWVVAEVVVTGDAAAWAALPDIFPCPKTLELAVPEQVVGFLRGQADWAPSRRGAVKDRFALYSEWNHQNADSLRTRAWCTGGGMYVASLADVMASKDASGLLADQTDMAMLSAALQNPGRPPLPAAILEHEIATVRRLLPEAVSKDRALSAGIQLAANGLHLVQTCYGHPVLHQPLPIVGDIEPAGSGARAFYHNGFELAHDGEQLVDHMQRVNERDKRAGRRPTFSLEDIVLVVAAEFYSDAVYGNGREHDNPERYDELRSAELVQAHAHALGLPTSAGDVLHAIVMGTGFSEHTRRQKGAHHPDPRVRAVVGQDLQGLSENDGFLGALCLAAEDLVSNRYAPGRQILARLARRHDIVLNTMGDVFAFIRTHGHERLDDYSGDTLLEAFCQRLIQTADFADPAHPTAHCYPRDWTLENQDLRANNARMQRQIARLLRGQPVPTSPAKSVSQ